MSFAPRDSHISQVQFALERGVPAMIGVVGAHRLPYPARAFDIAHCSRCLIPWHAEGDPSPIFEERVYFLMFTIVLMFILQMVYSWLKSTEF